MSDSKLERIEAKIDKISDRLNQIEVDIAKSEAKIFRRIISMVILVLGLCYSAVKLTFNKG